MQVGCELVHVTLTYSNYRGTEPASPILSGVAHNGRAAGHAMEKG